MKRIVLVSILSLVSSVAMASNLWFSTDSFSDRKNEYCGYSINIPVLAARDSKSPVLVTLVESLNADWKSDAASLIAGYTAESEGTDRCREHFESVQLNYDFTIETPLANDVVSIVFSHSSYTGGAHGYTGRSAQVFNTATGETYSNLGAFFDNSKLEKIKASVEAKLKEREYFDPTFGWESVKEEWKSVSDITNFYVTGNGIVIYFDPYAVGSYAEGPIDVVIYGYEAREEIGLKEGVSELFKTQY